VGFGPCPLARPLPRPGHASRDGTRALPGLGRPSTRRVARAASAGTRLPGGRLLPRRLRERALDSAIDALRRWVPPPDDPPLLDRPPPLPLDPLELGGETPAAIEPAAAAHEADAPAPPIVRPQSRSTRCWTCCRLRRSSTSSTMGCSSSSRSRVGWSGAPTTLDRASAGARSRGSPLRAPANRNHDPGCSPRRSSESRGRGREMDGHGEQHEARSTHRRRAIIPRLISHAGTRLAFAARDGGR
jgi:hypothetical protein